MQTGKELKIKIALQASRNGTAWTDKLEEIKKKYTR